MLPLNGKHRFAAIVSMSSLSLGPPLQPLQALVERQAQGTISGLSRHSILSFDTLAVFVSTRFGFEMLAFSGSPFVPLILLLTLFRSPSSFSRCSGTDNTPQRRGFNKLTLLSHCCSLDATRNTAAAPDIRLQAHSSEPEVEVEVS